MHQGHRRGRSGVAEVRIILFHLLGHKHALVSDRAGRKAGNVEPLAAGNFVAVPDRLLRLLADDVKFPFVSLVAGDRGRAAHKNLLHVRLGFHCRLAQRGIIHRHIAPAEDSQAFGGHKLDELRLHGGAFRQIRRQKQLADTILAGGRQGETKLRRFGGKKVMRHLNENARTIPGVRLAATGATVIQVDQYLQRIRHQLMGFLPFDVHNEPEPTGVVFELWIIKTLLRWRGNTRLVYGISFLHCIKVNTDGNRSAFIHFLLNFHRSAINVFQKYWKNPALAGFQRVNQGIDRLKPPK